MKLKHTGCNNEMWKLKHVGARHCTVEVRSSKPSTLLSIFGAPIVSKYFYYCRSKTRGFFYEVHKSCQNISTAVGINKTRAFGVQIFISSTVGITKLGLLYEVHKSCQNISSSVGGTKSRVFGKQMLSKLR